LDWEIDHVDIVGAYLNCELDKEIYMEAPPGVITEGKSSGKVVRLLRVLYRLKQAGRAWWKKLTEELIGMGQCGSVCLLQEIE
jgi:hypothetical protein